MKLIITKVRPTPTSFDKCLLLQGLKVSLEVSNFRQHHVAGTDSVVAGGFWGTSPPPPQLSPEILWYEKGHLLEQ